MLESVFSKAADLRECTFIKKELQHSCFPVNFAKFLRAPILKNICERLVLYFHYNFHHHYHEHYCHYHCKMQLNHQRILLTIPLNFNMIPCLFHLNYFFFFPYSKLFVSNAQLKGVIIRLRPPDKF